MECLYCEELHDESSMLRIADDEFRHFTVLRVREDEQIMITNGRGLSCIAQPVLRTKNYADLRVLSFLTSHGELGSNYQLVIGCLDNKDRMEWLVEKATELGIQGFHFVRTHFASQRPLHEARLKLKALSAVKQCKRSVLPFVREHQNLEDCLNALPDAHLLLADMNGQTPSVLKGDCVAIVGPEGGFHEHELQRIREHSRYHSWKLSPSRLRAETAALSMLAHFASW